MTTTLTPLTDEQLEAVQQTLHDHLGPNWTQDYVEGSADEAAYYRVATAEGTVLATVPDWAGSIALFLVEAHDYVPKLLAEITQLRATVAAVTAKAEEFPLLDDETDASDYQLGRHDLAESIRHIVSNPAWRGTTTA